MAEALCGSREDVEARHRREKKELQAKVTALKKTATKGDKKRKKEVAEQIAAMESALRARHEEELSVVEGGEVEEDEEEARKVGSGGAVNTAECDDAAVEGTRQFLDDLSVREGSDSAGAPDDVIGVADAELKKKPNRQRQRKERKAAQAAAMRKEAEKEASVMVDKGKIESEALRELTEVMKLRIKEVPPDGHCLYNAVADQLATYHSTEVGYTELRRNVADHMQAHADDFIPFMTNANGDMQSTEEFAAYCRNLENTATWGGQPEILAISKIYKLPVHIVQAGSPVVRVGEEYQSSRPIKLSYHRHMYSLGEHYNSLRDV